MDLLKSLSKLKKMSGQELTFRSRQKIRQEVEKLRFRRSQQGELHDLFFPEEMRNSPKMSKLRFRDDLHFFGISDDPQKFSTEFRRFFPRQYKAIIMEADRLLEHRFHLLGIDFSFPGEVQWTRNPQSGKDYPDVYYAMFNTGNPHLYGDVKYVWELNRHQFFIDVGMAYFLTREEKYAEKILEWLESWIAANPFKIGINHTSVLEHAVRVFSWVWTYFLTRHSAAWTDTRRKKLLEQLFLHAVFIEENLSFYYSPYNHLIGELAALSFLGIVLDGPEQPRIWREKYWNELAGQLPHQFSPDGFTVEQASYYHHFTLGFYIQVALLRQNNNYNVNEDVWAFIENAVEFSFYLTRPDGRIPMIGDIDSARSLYFGRPDEMWDLRYFQAIGAAVFKNSNLNLLAESSFHELSWL
ncbi:MAG: heparinase II/III family protein, partial [Calditrichia bacterium]